MGIVPAGNNVQVAEASDISFGYGAGCLLGDG